MAARRRSQRTKSNVYVSQMCRVGLPRDGLLGMWGDMYFMLNADSRP